MYRPRRASTRRAPSVDDVECEAKRPIELSACDFVKLANGLSVEVLDRHCDHIVAGDYATLGQPLIWPDLNFAADTSNCSRDRSAGDSGQNRDCCVAGEDANRAATGGRAEVDPENVVACYHAGAVSAARRRAD